MSTQIEIFRQLLCKLGQEIRDTLYQHQQRNTEELSAIAAKTQADTIYEIDKVSEELILAWLKENWPAHSPVRLIMEGIEDDQFVTFPANAEKNELLHQLIIDPIDGTRGLMYDKRPAWALIGLAPHILERQVTLEDIEVAVMTELPTSKQFISEQLSATRFSDGETAFYRVSKNLISNEEHEVPHRLSKATDLKHGFASIAKFFPQCKAALAQFEEELYAELTPENETQEALIFDDQYISTGGQLYELIAGHDRLVIDVRPLAFEKANLPLALSCHPYDLCTALVAKAAGVVIELPGQETLDIPLDTTTPVSWIAYANPMLAEKIRPVVSRLIQKHF
ncbi:inositol monophosphatase family protein [Pelagicoccus albus]|uniref:Inositol monophosphatase n=1 Tax=Pelagicoccus albus TaxID=415222 RepID=A0A7X1B795_9BACT|nr:inositol monophosphatase family protein [Pelagicoccus albus]MBC2606957.1 inositol monophosphatase [Pelagicoccus albus]